MHVFKQNSYFQEEEEGSWWEGSLNGKVGVFPSNFVEIIGDKEETGRLTPGIFTCFHCSSILFASNNF